MPINGSNEPIDYEKRFEIARDTTLSSGDVRLIMGISQQQVNRLIDEGLLKGRRVPMSTHRRAEKTDVEKHMTDGGMKIPAWIRTSELHVDQQEPVNGELHVRSAFELGIRFFDRSVTKVVIHEDAVGGRGAAIEAAIRAECERRAYPVPEIAIVRSPGALSDHAA